MANPTKDEFISILAGAANDAATDALGGISGSAELSDEQMIAAMQGVQDMLYTVAPDKGKPSIKIKAPEA